MKNGSKITGLRNIFKKTSEEMKTRSFKVGGYSVAATAIVIVLLILVNVIIGALPSGITRIDTTAGKLFTVSEQTRVLTEALDKDIEIYWVVRDGYEDAYIDTLLERYKQMSSHISVTKRDPDVYPSFISKYTSSPTDNSLIVICGDVYKYVSYYDIYQYDYSNYYYDGTYDVSFAGENALTSALDYVTSDDLPTMYALSGHGELTLSDDFSSAVSNQNIRTENLSILTEGKIPDDADLLLIYSPEHDISEEEKDILSRYLLDGGKLIYISDPPETASEGFVNIESVIENYGVHLTDGIVIEQNPENYYWSYPYYLIPDLCSHDLTASLISGGYNVMLPLAQGLTADSEEELDVSVSVSPLFTTSNKAYSKTAGRDLTTYDKEETDIEGPFDLGVIITQQIDENTSAKIIWITSGALVDSMVNEKVSGANMDFFLNAVNYMCEKGENSLQIHAKELSYQYLNMSSAAASVLAVLFVGIIPAAYLAFGIVRKIRRKKV